MQRTVKKPDVYASRPTVRANTMKWARLQTRLRGNDISGPHVQASAAISEAVASVRRLRQRLRDPPPGDTINAL